jgi:large conductance mechanosensitive channel
MLKEFKAFINNGNVFQVAVGLLMALAFKPVVDSVVDIVTNIVSRIFGAPDFSSLTIGLGDSSPDAPVIRYGVLINSIISFLIVAIVLFMLVKAYNKMTRADEEVAGPTEIELLTEIRDGLRR